MQSECPHHLVLDPGGDVFPCDFFLDGSWVLDNIRDQALTDTFRSGAYHRFHALKPDLSQACRLGRWLPQCQGGCPQTRTQEPTEGLGVDYFCATIQQFLPYADGRLRLLAKSF